MVQPGPIGSEKAISISMSPSENTGSADQPGDPGESSSRAAQLYERISADPDLTQSLFRQALQDPGGALDRIVALGNQLGLPVDRQEVKAYVASLEDHPSKQWLLKARGGL